MLLVIDTQSQNSHFACKSALIVAGSNILEEIVLRLHILLTVRSLKKQFIDLRKLHLLRHDKTKT